MIRVLVTMIVCFALSKVIGHFLLPVLRALKAGQSILKIGPSWHSNKAGTPMMGGWMFILGTLICLLANIPSMKDYTVFYVYLLALAFGIIGSIDDFAKIRHKQNEGLSAFQKMMLQLAVCALFLYIMYRTGGLTSMLWIPFANVQIHIHPMLYILLIMFVMVGCVNAVNLTDGVDGLSSSVTIPVMTFFVMVSCAMGKFELALMPACIIGGLMAYLTYNWHPAKLFMGDTGSLFLGGAVCAIAIALDMPLILIFVGFVYICETLSVILQVSYFKLTHGKRLFKMSPIHHHFELCGWKEEKIVLTFAAVSALMCVIAWFGVQGVL